MTRTCSRLVVLAACAVGLSCIDLLGPDLPEGTVPLSPLPAEYEGWWSLTERCSGRRGNLADVEWLVLPGTRVIPDTGGATGLYSPRDHAIVVGEFNVRDGWLVRHEMLHALLGGGRHGRSAFVDNCGGIVSCGTVCTREAGTPPRPGAGVPSMDPSKMEVDVELVPTSVRLASDTQGCTTIVVSVRNTENRKVQAYVGESRSQGFSWLVEGEGGGSGLRGDGASEVAFAAGGTRRYTFDCPNLIASELSPGDYAVRGRFLTLRSEPAAMTLIE